MNLDELENILKMYNIPKEEPHAKLDIFWSFKIGNSKNYILHEANDNLIVRTDSRRVLEKPLRDVDVSELIPAIEGLLKAHESTRS